MSEGRFHVRKAAVLGAGVMGAQIAGHLCNAGIPTVLFELAAKEGDPNGLVNKAIANLGKLKPAPLGEKSVADGIIPANYDQHLHLIDDCDLIIEAVAERMDIKRAVYDKVENRVKEGAIIASNTSGLSITGLADSLPDKDGLFIKGQFAGILPVRPVDKIGDGMNTPPIGKTYGTDRLAVNHGHLFAGAQICDCIVPSIRFDPECHAMASASPVETQHEPRLLRSAAMDMGIDAKPPVSAGEMRADTFGIVKTRPPHQRSVSENPVCFVHSTLPATANCRSKAVS